MTGSVENLSSEELVLDPASSDSCESDLDKNNNRTPPSSLLGHINHQPNIDFEIEAHIPECSRTMATADPFVKTDSPDSAGYASSEDIEEQEEGRFPRSILKMGSDTDAANRSSDSEKPPEENGRHYLNRESRGTENTNHNSNKKKLRKRRSSDIENNNNLPKPRLRRSVQLSSVRVGSGMASKNRLKPYMSRMISRDGSTNIQIKNHGYLDLFTRYTRDIYTTIVDLNMLWVLLLTAFVYIGQWLIFGVVYHLYAIQNGDVNMQQDGNATSSMTQNEPCVSNVYDFVSAFMFSMESETTIGYGSRTMGVVCPWAVTTLVVQCVMSAIFDTWLIGLCYAKFTSPYLRSSTVVFAKNAVICTRDGKRCLIVRVANLRKSLLLSVSCRARVITLREARRRDGNDGNLQQDELQFSNANSIMLTAPIEYCHVIDKTSPLYSIPEKYFASEDQDWFEVVVILSGTIEATGMALHAQTSYLSSEIRYKHRFARILSENDKRNRYIVNFKQFHDTEMEPANIVDVPTSGNETVSSTNRKCDPLPETLEEEESDEVFELPGVPHCDNHLDDNQI